MQLERDFSDRESLISYYREQFPDAVDNGSCVSTTRGGIDEARQKLAAVDPIAYGRTRNDYDGAVTQLSPYLRHGVLDLAATMEHVRSLVGHPREATKLLQELAWRDYWRRVLDQIGNNVWEDLEPYKTGYEAEDYCDELPNDFLSATTGIDFVDATVTELHETGYLHNQARMKIAAYVVHWRRIRWQAGARWMLTHLLDGDIASNNLSWQWVASTFAVRPYIFNLDNLLKVTGGQFTGCLPDGSSPFEGSYDDLNERLFQ